MPGLFQISHDYFKLVVKVIRLLIKVLVLWLLVLGILVPGLLVLAIIVLKLLFQELE